MGVLSPPQTTAHRQYEQLKILIALLTARDRRPRPLMERVHDVFQGSPQFRYFQIHWVRGLGLLEGNMLSNDNDWKTSLEGRAVVTMLLATRSPEVFGVALGREAVRIKGDAADRGDAADADRLAAFERLARERLVHAFVRETIDSLPVISLHRSEGDAAAPGVRTIWTADFGDEGSRDDLYRWLVERIAAGTRGLSLPAGPASGPSSGSSSRCSQSAWTTVIVQIPR